MEQAAPLGREHDTRQERSRTAAAYEVIRAAIVTWELAPGEHVTEGHLAERTGFGRAPVRSALARLSHEGLVVAMPRRGYQVAPITFKYVADVFGVRMVLEPAAARQVAARGDPDVVAELEAINARCRYVPEPYDAPALRLANKEFHVAIARATGNERLAGITSATLDDLQRILYLPQVARETDRVAATFDEHARIVDAIRRRDPHAAEAAAIAHIELNKTMLIDLLIGTAEIGSINLFHS
jgi:DNA-binding GntR family transcriptional regulator